MKKQVFTAFLVIALCWVFLVGLAFPAKAQAPTATPVPTSAPTSVPTSAPTVAAAIDTNTVTFAQLKQGEFLLNGPFEDDTFSFAIPANWALKPETQLELLVGVSFNTVTQQSNIIIASGGTLTVYLNNTILAILPLNQIGELEQKISIPVSAFTTTRADGRMALRFLLDASESCRIIGAHTTVTIHSTSYLTLPHDNTAPSTSLLNFPSPIIQNSFIQDSALLIIPDQPSPAELQAALTVAAGFGNLSAGSMALDLTTLGKFASSQVNTSVTTNNHLIFVGKPSSLPVLSQFALPLQPKAGKFENQGGGADDGVVEMVGSPWSQAHMVLVISGNTDQGIIKAAQAVSTGVLRPNSATNFAVVSKVNQTPLSNLQAVDATLKDLGYSGSSFQSIGGSGDEYVFNLPVGMTVAPDAYFEVIFGNSALLDYNRSQINVFLNDQPIGSIRMNDVTAGLPTNHVKIMIPPTGLVPGRNRLDVRVDIEPIDDCSPRFAQQLWINIWPESSLHLPLVANSTNAVGPQNLAVYPAPFVYSSVLDTTAFVLEHNELTSWKDALQIAAYLGAQANGPLTELSVFYGDNVPAAERSKYHFILVGRRSAMPIIGEINDKLPAPFSTGSDMASDQNLQVQYRIPPDSPMGYVEMMVSPWNSNNIVLAILGNTTQGVDWAASSLVDSTLRSRLGGNYAVVNAHQIITANTGLVSNTSGQSPVQAPNTVAGPSSPATTSFGARPAWSFALLLVSIILILLILVFVVGRRWLRDRKGNPPKDS